MTKDVILTIEGLHNEVYPGEEEGERVEVITPGNYYFKNGKHYVVYEEVVEGCPGTSLNKVRITGDQMLEVIKSGEVAAHMVFEKGKMNVTEYQTPFGEITVGVYTKSLTVEETEQEIDVQVYYALDVNGEKVADCDIRMNVKAKRSI